MIDLCTPEDLPKYVPGKLLLSDVGLGWSKVGLRSFHYEGQDVIVPAMRDFVLIGYQVGDSSMRRRLDGCWSRDRLGPGAASLLTRAQPAQWHWIQPVEVTQVYLTETLVSEVASEVMDCHVNKVGLADVLRTEDPVLITAIEAIRQEALGHALGGPLYVESIARALIVHLMRRYASIRIERQPVQNGLTPAQRRRIEEYIDIHLEGTLDLAGMAAALNLTTCVFSRMFRQSFGRPAYAYVIARRVDKAEHLLARSKLPIKEISAVCGFADQAHLTRLFVREKGKTPAAFRKSA